jgi:hypothetical protein
LHKNGTNDNDSCSSATVLLTSGDSRIKIQAYDLLTASFATKAAIPLTTLSCLSLALRAIHDDNDAYERGEIMGISRRFLNRLDNSYTGLSKLKATGQESSDDAALLAGYETFVLRFVHHLSSELEMGVSYPRHILALGHLQLLMKTSFHHWQHDVLLAKRLLLLVLDPYDDVRAIAAGVLGKLREQVVSGSTVLETGFLDSVLALSAATCRNDHADAAGRVIALTGTSHLESTDLATASEKYSTATTILARLQGHLSGTRVLSHGTSFPLHANILALVHLYAIKPATKAEVELAINVCVQIWKLVQPVLCVDSPETGTEDLDDDVQGGGPKDLLAYSWRALRDSSLLLQAVVRVDHCSSSQVGSLCLDQLILLRHRGAFSTVAQSFAMCCDIVRESPDASVDGSIRNWYAIALVQIDEQASKVTRRSAGLPAIFNGLLSPNEPDFFHEVIAALRLRTTRIVVAHANGAGAQMLPQVHALNCIKDIVTNSKFRSLTEQYIFDLIELAADRMSSSVWAIRNCGLMLLRACMSRLNPKLMDSSSRPPKIEVKGTADSPRHVALSLFESVDEALAVGEDTTERSEKIFAALDLVRQTGSSATYDKALRAHIREQLGSPLWAVRQYAARVLASGHISTTAGPDLLQQVSIPPDASENEVHGLLLLHRSCVELLLEQAPVPFESILQSIPKTVQDIQEIVHRRPISPFMMGALLDMLNFVLSAMLEGTAHAAERSNFVATCQNALLLHTTSHTFAYERVLLTRCLCILSEATYSDEQSILPTASLVAALGDDSLTFVVEQLEQLIPQLHANGTAIRAIWALLGTLKQRTTLPACIYNAMATVLATGHVNLVPRAAARLNDVLAHHDSLSGNRDTWNASIKMRAHVLRTLIVSNAEDAKEWHLRMQQWLADVGQAGTDEIEFPTRLNAARALLALLSGHGLILIDDTDVTGAVTIDALKLNTEIHLQLLSIVYDQLNDDDEEIRQVAEETAARLLWPKQAVELRSCAFAARQDILNLFKTKILFCTEPELHDMVLRRLLDCNAMSWCSWDPVTDSLESRLRKIINSMNDLFAEEKQNLYIDEMDEVRRWSAVLCACKEEIEFDLRRWQIAIRWVVDGLKAMKTALTKEADAAAAGTGTNGLGLTYNVDVLGLCTRAMCLAEVMAKVDARDGLCEEVLEEIRDGLAGLKLVLRETDAHPSLLFEEVSKGSEQAADI